LSEQSSGVFDVFSTDGGHAQAGGWRDLEIDPLQQRLRKHAVIQADLGGIAKGYAVDAAVNALRAAGAGSGWINAGGDLRVFGPLELPLEVRAPWNPGHTITCTMLSNQAAATSASYWLKTPVLRHGVTRKTIAVQASWTVCAPACMAADALTKLVAATGDVQHPVLALHQAQAWVYAGAGDHGAEAPQHTAH
jgi:thiamine biosynthesis lipoprotein